MEFTISLFTAQEMEILILLALLTKEAVHLMTLDHSHQEMQINLQVNLKMKSLEELEKEN